MTDAELRMWAIEQAIKCIGPTGRQDVVFGMANDLERYVDMARPVVNRRPDEIIRTGADQ